MVEQLSILLDAARYRLQLEDPTDNYRAWKAAKELVDDLSSALNDAENYRDAKCLED